MPLRPIVRLGHPALRSVAQAVPPGRLSEPAIQELIDDMVATMRDARGVGLAAPQVGASLQIFVYELAPPQPPIQAATEPSPQPSRTGPASAPAPTAQPVQLPQLAQLAQDAAQGPVAAPPVASRDTPGSSLPAGERTAAVTIPLRVVVNPMLTPQAGELVYDWEGCLSIPDLRGLVPRHPAVRVRGLDREGQPLDYVAQGFEARIIQHEYDHLNGVVFLDRMRDFKALAFREEWERYMAAGAAEPPDPLDPEASSAQPQPARPEEPVLAAARRGDPEVI
jgi:peptide deformylase